VKIRNPWGQSEWTGNVMKRYPDWKMAPKSLWKDIGYRESKYTGVVEDACDDGEFVMSVADMVQEFQDITFCTLRETLEKEGWQIKQEQSMWVTGSNAGGCKQHKSFPTNPQLSIKVKAKSKIRIDLEQKVKDRQYHEIGLSVFQDKNLKKKMGKVVKFSAKPVLEIQDFWRSVILSGTLQKGDYIIVPYTNSPNQQAKFLLTTSILYHDQ